MADTNDANNHSLPTAVEVQNEAAISGNNYDSSGSLKKQKRFMLLVGLSVLTIALIVGLSVSFGTTKKSAREKPTVDPNAPRLEQFLEYLTFLSPEVKLRRAGSPQNLAAVFLANDDGAQLDLPATTQYDDAFPFLQRYILTVFYYSLAGPEWDSQMQFLSDASVCDWNFQLDTRTNPDDDFVQDEELVMGVQCDEFDEVNYLFMPSLGLVGSLPREVGFLLGVEHWSMAENNITGAFPDGMKYLDELRFLGLENNQLTGPIPDWFASLSNLETLNLGNNLLTGDLSALANLANLTQVALDSNLLTGTIDVFASMVNIESLYLQNNKLSGALNDQFLPDASLLRNLDVSDNRIDGNVPVHLLYSNSLEILDAHGNLLSGALPANSNTNDDDASPASRPMKFLSLYGNKLSGSIPDSLSILTSLTHLGLSNNTLTGAIPASLNKLTNLLFLFLSDNDFAAGRMPALYNLRHLQELSMRNNQMTGAIPPWIGSRLTNLVLLDVGGNALNSSLPENLGNLANLNFLLINRNKLTGIVPDTLADLTELTMLMGDKNNFTGDLSTICDNGPAVLQDWLVFDCPAEVDCPCCSDCCSDDDDTCNDFLWVASLDDAYTRNEYVFSEDVSFQLN